jgi:hypothetical protein
MYLPFIYNFGNLTCLVWSLSWFCPSWLHQTQFHLKLIRPANLYGCANFSHLIHAILAGQCMSQWDIKEWVLQTSAMTSVNTTTADHIIDQRWYPRMAYWLRQSQYHPEICPQLPEAPASDADGNLNQPEGVGKAQQGLWKSSLCS